MTKKFKYMNNYTGELYISLLNAFTTIIADMIHNKKCRTIKMLSISKDV